MKLRHILLAAAAALVCATSLAVPARPGAFKYTQPDGSVILLERHGDEFYSWTTLAGTDQAVALGEDGFWHKTTLDPTARQAAMQSRRLANANRVMPRTHNDDPLTHGERHIPVLLVNFADVSFQINDPKAQFNALLNEKGYSANGATGSVQDFYYENSHGAFTPVFDVYGPVTLSHNMAYYGAPAGSSNDTRPQDAVKEAAQLLDDVIDFSQYDDNNDGRVDMILMYYAGYNQAEGGPEDSIWPHQWSIPGNVRLDGKTLGTYFCTSELRLSSGVDMCGIGTTCHEFGHSLGLPDFYDSDYYTNGYASGLYWFSTMCSGSYNNDGRTPPYFNSEERIILGWMSDDDVPKLKDGAVTVGPVYNDIAFRSQTDTDGEYFLYECRDATGWDAPLPAGLLVYHVDKSTVRSVGGMTPYEQWTNWVYYNTINAYGDHPCFYVVPAADQTSLDYSGSAASIMFPGSYGITTYTPIDWEDMDTGYSLSGISYNNGQVSLSVSISDVRFLTGTVTHQDGTPVQGVSIVLSEPAAASPMLRRAHPRQYACVTDSDGSFSISLEGYTKGTAHLTLSKEGYQTKGVDVTLVRRITKVTLTILKNGEEEMTTYSYFDPTGDLYYGGYPDYGNSQMVSIRIPAADLPADGGEITNVAFMPYLPADAYYLIIDAGEERLFTAEIAEIAGGMENMVSLNLNGAEFPAGKDLYVGYAVQNASTYYEGYPFIVGVGSHHTWYSRFNLEQSTWDQQEDEGYDLVLTATIVGKTADPEDPENPWTLARMGFNAIADPGNGTYKAGDAFPLGLELIEGVTATAETWTFDGQDITGAKSVSLTSGTHTVTAKVSLSDGTKETLQLIINVQ